MKKRLLIPLILLSVNVFSQPDSILIRYNEAYAKLDSIIQNSSSTSFKRAVYLVENTYLNNKIEYAKYENYISDLADLAKDWIKFNRLKDYRYPDSLNIIKNLAAYKVLKDTIKVFTSKDSGFAHIPYEYDFDDFAGSKDWRNMFVTKLMAYHSGNCHSFPYLYKILADELDATCWLSLAPNHIYIKNRCKGMGWYNTELTSGQFPIDAWITASGYIPLKAIQSGIYMDTLSNQQAIALCVLDLAKGYEFQTKNYYDGFIIKCCDLSLKYFPLNVQAMLLKAETLKRIYEKQKAQKNMEAEWTYQEMQKLYVRLFDLGYREMPKKMYLDWLTSVTKQKEKYSNKQINKTIK